MKQQIQEILQLLRAFKWRELLYKPSGNSLLQFLRYLIVGGSAFVADTVTLRLLEYANFHYLWAAAGGFILGVSVNYVLSKVLAFAGMEAKVSKRTELILFLAISLMGLALTELLMYLFKGLLGYHSLISKAISAAIVFLWNFFAKKLLYKKAPKP